MPRWYSARDAHAIGRSANREAQMPPKIPYDSPSAAETGRAVRDGRYTPTSERDRKDVEEAKAARRGSAKTSSARMASY
jgi:hypothetical protein